MQFDLLKLVKWLATSNHKKALLYSRVKNSIYHDVGSSDEQILTNERTSGWAIELQIYNSLKYIGYIMRLSVTRWLDYFSISGLL